MRSTLALRWIELNVLRCLFEIAIRHNYGGESYLEQHRVSPVDQNDLEVLVVQLMKKSHEEAFRGVSTVLGQVWPRSIKEAAMGQPQRS